MNKINEIVQDIIDARLILGMYGTSFQMRKT